MRRGFVIVGVGALVIASVGFVRRLDSPSALETREAREAAQPEGSSAAAPGASAPVAPAAVGDVAPGSRLATQRLLRARDFSILTRLVEAKQARVDQDVRLEDDLARVVLTFNTADPSMTPLLDAWVAAEPTAYAPRLARAEHEIALAWDRRGTKRSSETSEEQKTEFRAFLMKAIEDAQDVVRRRARVAEAYRILIVAAMGYGDQQACARVAERGIAAVPASVRIRVALAQCFLPRWGGSYALMEAVAAESDTQVERNPALSALHGFVAWDRARAAESDRQIDEALALYSQALDKGEHWLFYRHRGRVYLNQHRYTEALEDAVRGLALAPEEPDLLVLRADALAELGRSAEAVPDIRLVVELDPTNDDFARFRSRELETAAHQGYQRLEMTKDLNGAIARLTDAIDLVGGDAEVYYWRGRAYLRKDDEAHALPDFEAAIRIDPHHYESYRNVDYLLAKRGDWDGVIRHWTQYVELEPMNGRAYLERGGAYNRKGDRTAALADAKRACDLGTREACEIKAHARAR
jgi:tetratricopeptide (TPR) repeat protein